MTKVEAYSEHHDTGIKDKYTPIPVFDDTSRERSLAAGHRKRHKKPLRKDGVVSRATGKEGLSGRLRRAQSCPDRQVAHEGEGRRADNYFTY